MSTMCKSLIILTMASVATLSHAFTPTRPRHATISLKSQSNDGPPGGDGEGGRDSDEGAGDEALLDELRRTKKDLFGADIPSNDELRGAAKNAEDAFLAAMVEQTREFREIKSAEGSEAAVDAFRGRIQEADEEARRADARGGGEAGNGGEGGDSRRGESDTWQ